MWQMLAVSATWRPEECPPFVTFSIRHETFSTSKREQICAGQCSGAVASALGAVSGVDLRSARFQRPPRTARRLRRPPARKLLSGTGSAPRSIASVLMTLFRRTYRYCEVAHHCAVQHCWLLNISISSASLRHRVYLCA